MLHKFAPVIGSLALGIAVLPGSALAQACGDGVFADQAMAAAKAAPPVASCVLQEWEATPNGGESGDENVDEKWQVRAYERFLACYRSDAGHGAVGELGVDTEKRRVPSGTRFTATVTCSAQVGCGDAAAADPVCEVAWTEPDCCYDMDHNKY